MAKDHGPGVKNDKQYEGLHEKGMSKERAARIANSPDPQNVAVRAPATARNAKRRVRGGNKAQKAAAERKGGKASS
jgi:hypothetical protein